MPPLSELDPFLRDVTPSLHQETDTSIVAKLTLYLLDFYHKLVATSGDVGAWLTTMAVVCDNHQRVFAHPIDPSFLQVHKCDASIVGAWIVSFLLQILRDGPSVHTRHSLQLLADALTATATTHAKQVKRVILANLEQSVALHMSSDSSGLMVTVAVYAVVVSVSARLRLTVAQTCQLDAIGRRLWFKASASDQDDATAELLVVAVTTVTADTTSTVASVERVVEMINSAPRRTSGPVAETVAMAVLKLAQYGYDTKGVAVDYPADTVANARSVAHYLCTGGEVPTSPTGDVLVDTFVDRLVRGTGDVDDIVVWLNKNKNLPCREAGDWVDGCCRVCGAHHTRNPYNLVRKSRPDVPPSLDEFVARLMAIDEKVALVSSLPVWYSLLASYVARPIHIDFLLGLATNSCREVRLQTARVLAVGAIHSREDYGETIIRFCENQLSTGTPWMGETVVAILVGLAITGDEDSTGYKALCALVETFGHANDQFGNFAYLGVISVAVTLKVAPWKLLLPLLADLSKTLLSSPRALARVAEMGGKNPKFIIRRISEYVVAEVLEDYKHDYIADIARHLGVSKGKVVMDALPRVIAYHITKPDFDEEHFIMALTNASQRFANQSMATLVAECYKKSLWCTLMCFEDDNVERVRRGLAVIVGGSASVTEALGNDALWLVANFGETVHEMKRMQSAREKVAALRLLEFLIAEIPEQISVGLGQISTCLQACLSMSPVFKYHALRCWQALLTHIAPSKMVSVMDIVLSCVLQVYGTLEETRSKSVAVAILQSVFRSDAASNTAGHYFWSLPFNAELDSLVVQKVDARIEKGRAHMVGGFAARLATGNAYVVDQALVDSRNFFKRYQREIHASLEMDPLLARNLARLVHQLLEVGISRCQQVAEVLAELGTFDPKSLEIKKTESPPLVILWDFCDDDEIYRWVRSLIEDRLVPQFWASKNPNRQLFYAYAMQELIAVFKHVIKGYSDVARATLLPLSSSAYVGPKWTPVPVEYPIFPRARYEVWICTFCDDLFARLADKSRMAKRVIRTIQIAIKDRDDVGLCQYLLRYAVVSHVVSDERTVVPDILTELLAVLTSDSSSEYARMACSEVLAVLDYCNQWASEATLILSTDDGAGERTGRLKRYLKNINAFVEAVSPEIIANRAVECQMYERSILTLESMYKQHPNQALIPTLQKMYASIGDYDSLNGVIQQFSSSDIVAQLGSFEFNSNQNWSLAQESFEVAGKAEEKLQAMCDRGNYAEVLSALASAPNSASLASIGVASAVLSGDLDAGRHWLMAMDSVKPPQDSVVVKMARELTGNFRHSFSPELYGEVGRQLVTSTSPNFNANYPLFCFLHAMADMTKILKNEVSEDALAGVLASARPKDQWTILQFHRLAYNLGDKPNLERRVILHSARWARVNRRFDLAGQLLVRAMNAGVETSLLEYARLLWDQGKHPEAIVTLRKFKESHDTNYEVQLQYAKWLDESAHVSSDEIIAQYEAAQESGKPKAYFELAGYLNKILDSQSATTGYYEVNIIRNLMRAIVYGREFAFDAVPKLLTIWLDFAQLCVDEPSKERSSKHEIIVKDLDKQKAKVPMASWYVGITQILSRFLHPNAASYQVLHSILLGIAHAYPAHALWYILSHRRSNDELRCKRIASVLKHTSMQASHGEVISAGVRLVDRFIDIAKVKPPKSWRNQLRKFSLHSDFKIQGGGNHFGKLVVPVGQYLDIHTKPVYLDSIEDAVVIFWSLQAPRKISVRCSDGHHYQLMVKQDDTRKDAKVVEFTTAVNRQLDREHTIVNYAVIPLSNHFGVIEFVEDVTTFKQALITQRMRMGISFREGKLAMKLDKAQKPESSKSAVDVFNGLIKDNPPVLSQWFITQFTDPGSWYRARSQFIRSLAVMSMVGYYIGLGDRHCENILLFVKSGKVLHIDFECLFEKGLTLPVPELVPFRLTHNFVDGMGVCGYEGKFRATCERVGTSIRENEAPLMNILQTLLYDPLLDWKTDKKTTPTEQLAKVRRKIRGLMQAKEEIPVNIEGQVDKLIQESTSVEKLARMYAGWGPYI